MRKHTLLKPALVSAAVASALSMSAWAQEETETSQAEAIEKIQVTALRRATSIEDTGMSVSAIGGQELEQMGATNFKDFIRTLPGISFSETAAPGTQDIIIRGVNFPSNRFQMPTIAVYLDETNLSQNGRNPDIDLLDMQRVEVLRGPQGTLYGGSSMGGAIRYITNKPDTLFMEGWVESGLEYTKGGGIGDKQSFMLNTPITDTFALRFVGYRKDLDGWIDNIGYIHTGNYEMLDDSKAEEDYNDEYTLGGRIAARWEPTDNLTLDLSYVGHDVEVDGLADWNPNLVDKGNNGQGYGEYKAAVREPELYSDKNDIYNLTISYEADWGRTEWISTRTERDYRRISDVSRNSNGIDWWVGDFNSAFDYNLDAHVGSNGLPQSSFRVRPIEYTSESHELRFSGTAMDDRLNWVAGGIYSERDNQWTQREIYEGVENAYSSFIPFGFSTNYEAEAQDNPNEWGIIGTNLWFFSERDELIKEKAFYGNLAYRVTDAWEVSVGGRFFDVDVDNDYAQGGYFGGTEVSQAEGAFEAGEITEAEFHSVIADNVARNYRITQTMQQTEDDSQFMVNTSYDFGNTLVYATVSEGYRIGGINRVFPERDGSLPAPENFNSDSLVSAELGVKAQLMDHRLILDASVYDIDWDDIQLAVTDPVTSFDFTTNAGAASITGAEASALYRVTDSFELTAALTLLDHEITELDDIADLGAETGDPLLGVSDERFSLGAKYLFEINGLDSYVRADYNYTGDYIRDYFSEDDAPGFIESATGDSYGLVNLSAGINTADWDLSLYVRNLFNDDTVVSQDAPRESFNGWHPKYANVDGDPGRVVTIKPRTVGVTLRYRFD